MRRLPDILTLSRIAAALMLPFLRFLSPAFWAAYIWAGVSDILDGAAARKMDVCTDKGTRLDSIGDVIFAVSLFIVVIREIFFPLWLWVWLVVIAIIRLIGYGAGFCRFHCFSALHTYLNKLTGGLIFAFPLLFALLGTNKTGVILCTAALVSALEELFITLNSKSLERDIKGIFFK